MPIEMLKGLPFSVDTWTPSSTRKRHHFLTHAHKDHTVGISSQSFYPIYSTNITKSLLLQHLPELDSSLFVGIEIGETLSMDDNPDDGAAFSVTAFDANHCPDDSLWKLMDIDRGEPSPSSPPAFTRLAEIKPVRMVSPLKTKGSQLCSPEAKGLRLGLSPPSKRPSITLFGRARLALRDFSVLQEETIVLPSKTDCPRTIVEQESASASAKEVHCSEPVKNEVELVPSDPYESCVGASKNNLNESLKKLYRSMSIPVPRPLPSLVKMMNSRKRFKRSVQF